MDLIDSTLKLAQIILVDISLAADNAIVVALAAAGLAAHLRAKAIAIGIALAAILRIAFTFGATKLLGFPVILLCGGLALWYVCWQMWDGMLEGDDKIDDEDEIVSRCSKSLPHAIFAIIVADVSMSIDNVLAIAGIAKDNVPMLIAGLALSVVLMGIAANYIARIMEEYKWVGYLGLAIIFYVGCDMVWNGLTKMFQLGAI